MRKEVIKSGGRIVGKPFSGRPCIHGQEGRIEMPKSCIHHYECWHCPFDQWLAEIEGNPDSLDLLNPKYAVLAKAA
ncbi:MAG: hypothetical protein JRG79_16005 [Deltaproteobacteria bacterium]|nr:hypothetical protein [Deltaproteobacteria bacterium]MBW1941512.1 hypothetical protein [Deltaproteobacteria bacterium]MBW2208409.1 hypothetical protein [Deltaproteobacteria bacterium]